MHTCTPAYLHTCTLAYLHTCKLAYLQTCILAYIHSCICKQEVIQAKKMVQKLFDPEIFGMKKKTITAKKDLGKKECLKNWAQTPLELKLK